MQELKISNVGEKLIKEALKLSSRIKEPALKNKSFIDFAGGLFTIETLQKNGFRANSQRSIFKCAKLYSDFELVDIYCNSHMLYVVTVQNTNRIEIPCSHKEFNILPEAYLIVEIGNNIKNAEIKGVVEVEDLETAPVENGYFIFDSNNLKHIDSIKEKIKKYAEIKSSIGKHLECLNLFNSYIKNNLTTNEKKSLIEHILTCETCKKKLIETIEQSQNYEENEEEPVIDGLFVDNLKTQYDESPSKLIGAIDIIYKGKEFAKLKDEAFKFKNELSPKVKKMVLTACAAFLILLLLVVFAFNLPKKELKETNFQNNTIQNNYPTENEEENGYDFKIPTLVKNGKYITISKINWEVPTTITKDEQKNFLQQAGKSIKLNLQNDLLLSNDVEINSKIKFDLRFYKDGSIEEITVVESSNNKAVDEIIKQSLENTLQYMRPPKGSFVGKKNTITLVISF